ncbi:hypothetical protein [Halomonas sp. ML-15]|nr:hypothetical protein [Halomonas sp. ML-15]
MDEDLDRMTRDELIEEARRPRQRAPMSPMRSEILTLRHTLMIRP